MKAEIKNKEQMMELLNDSSDDCEAVLIVLESGRNEALQTLSTSVDFGRDVFSRLALMYLDFKLKEALSVTRVIKKR